METSETIKPYLCLIENVHHRNFTHNVNLSQSSFCVIFSSFSIYDVYTYRLSIRSIANILL